MTTHGFFMAFSPATPTPPSTPASTSASATVTSSFALCGSIRLAYATLLRITQLEQQLFDSLFNIEAELPGSIPSNKESKIAKPIIAQDELGILSKANQGRFEYLIAIYRVRVIFIVLMI